jgi:superoxide reductase
MTELRDLYHCTVCGNVVEVVHEGAPSLVCCEKPMRKLEARTEDKGAEKHVPVAEFSGDVLRVKIGEQPHPMEEDHFIKFIEVATTDKVFRKELSAGDSPEAEFTLAENEVKEIREYCTVHSLWKRP